MREKLKPSISSIARSDVTNLKSESVGSITLAINSVQSGESYDIYFSSKTKARAMMVDGNAGLVMVSGKIYSDFPGG